MRCIVGFACGELPLLVTSLCARIPRYSHVSFLLCDCLPHTPWVQLRRGAAFKTSLLLLLHSQRNFYAYEIYHFKLCSLVTDSLTEPKHVDLVMRLFKTRNTPTATVAMEKLVTWWHYVQCLGSRVWHHFDQVSVSYFSSFLSVWLAIFTRPTQ